MIRERFLIIFFTSFSLLLTNCKRESIKKSNYLINSKRIIKYVNLKYDSIILEKVNSSYVGFSRILDTNIFLVDQKFCWVFIFDKKGKFLYKSLGQGNGPKEINTGIINGYEYLKNTEKHFFIGVVEDCHLYDKDFNKIKTYFLSSLFERSKLGEKIITDEPLCDKMVYYSFPLIFILRNYKNYMFFPIVMEHPRLNWIVHPKKFFNSCHILAKMNLTNGKIIEIMGNYSNVYLENNKLKAFINVLFDIDQKGNFYISFEADSLIYVYDKNFNIKKVFGFEGRNINKNYKNLKTIEEFKKYYSRQREECGYYTWLEYIDEKKLLFRSYQKGGNAKTDGLQIYRNNVLIGDVDVPKGFRVDGYMSPYIFSQGIIDEEKEQVKIYRFKIEN